MGGCRSPCRPLRVRVPGLLQHRTPHSDVQHPGARGHRDLAGPGVHQPLARLGLRHPGESRPSASAVAGSGSECDHHRPSGPSPARPGLRRGDRLRRPGQHRGQRQRRVGIRFPAGVGDRGRQRDGRPGAVPQREIPALHGPHAAGGGARPDRHPGPDRLLGGSRTRRDRHRSRRGDRRSDRPLPAVRPPTPAGRGDHRRGVAAATGCRRPAGPTGVRAGDHRLAAGHHHRLPSQPGGQSTGRRRCRGRSGAALRRRAEYCWRPRCWARR